MLPIPPSPPRPEGPVAIAGNWRPSVSEFGRGLPRHDQSALIRGDFSFLNQRLQIGCPPDWNAADATKLWQYNLHYFEYLWSLDLETAKKLAAHWIGHHPFGKSRVGWEPYPLSLRLQNWCCYFLGLHRTHVESDQVFLAKLLRSIIDQAVSLESNLEYHLLGNHLLENAATLALVGTCLAGPDADRIRSSGFELLADQLEEQILPDGCHFERSPMYQSRLTYLIDQLAASEDDRLSALVAPRLRSMKDALTKMTHPDGEIALLNDAAFGIAPNPGGLVGSFSAREVFSLPAAGYYGARGEQGNYVIFDAAPVGPDYLPGHAHGDIFSFELSLGGSRVIVDSGTFDYESSEMRRYCRSTAAHNTMEVAGADQCEFWGTFRVGRRGRPHDVVFDSSTNGFTLSGWHDGYKHLAGRPVHSRWVRWMESGLLVVRDEVSASKSVPVVSRLHLHPHCEIEITGDQVSVRYPGGSCVIAWQGRGQLSAEDSWYCPEFGIRHRNQVLVYSAAAPSESTFCIAPDEESVSFEI
jgi:uncharacterized heparinase superfamily protein